MPQFFITISRLPVPDCTGSLLCQNLSHASPNHDSVLFDGAVCLGHPRQIIGQPPKRLIPPFDGVVLRDDVLPRSSRREQHPHSDLRLATLLGKRYRRFKIRRPFNAWATKPRCSMTQIAVCPFQYRNAVSWWLRYCLESLSVDPKLGEKK